MQLNKVQSALFAGGAAMFAISLLSLGEFIFSCSALLMAPLGATAVLIFGLPQSPLARAKNVILGHLVTAFIGLATLHFWGDSAFALAFATGLAISVMLLSDTTHPPAGANPILIILTHQHWTFLFTPVLVGSVTLVLIGFLTKKIINHEPASS